MGTSCHPKKRIADFISKFPWQDKALCNPKKWLKSSDEVFIFGWIISFNNTYFWCYLNCCYLSGDSYIHLPTKKLRIPFRIFAGVSERIFDGPTFFAFPVSRSSVVSLPTSRVYPHLVLILMICFLLPYRYSLEQLEYGIRSKLLYGTSCLTCKHEKVPYVPLQHVGTKSTSSISFPRF